MRTGTKLGAFALAVAAIFVVALIVGRAVGPIDVGSAAGAEHAAMGSASDVVGPYQVTMTGRALVGESTLSFEVAKDGEVVHTEPYAGAAGHLVAVRTGDLAVVDVHPRPSDDGDTNITFVAEFPSAGTYRLFVDFAHDGDVHTASFTVEVAGAADQGGH